MTIPYNKIYVRHLVQSNAKQVFDYCATIPVLKKDKYNFLYIGIKDCINFNAIITSNYTIYDEYVRTTNQKEHSVATFKKLIQEWDLAKMNPIELAYDGVDFNILDGVHRLSILYSLNGDKGVLPIHLCNIRYDTSIIKEIGAALQLTTKSSHYNGWSNSRKEYGYHSFSIFNVNIIGQRNPIQRITKMRKMYDFADKSVLDLGCNTGGILFHLFGIKSGIGVDFDATCISAANCIKKNLGLYSYLDFIQRDLQKDDISDLFIKKYNVIFLLSLGSWIKNWKEIYQLAIRCAPILFIETNNDKEGIPQLELFKEHNCTLELVSDCSDDDTTNNYGRKTYLIRCPPIVS
jgi:2-polyprenyl-3-methyl-5-hydroxy-6-metoxy-1,4-benzoquinol methylase